MKKKKKKEGKQDFRRTVKVGHRWMVARRENAQIHT